MVIQDRPRKEKETKDKAEKELTRSDSSCDNLAVESAGPLQVCITSHNPHKMATLDVILPLQPCMNTQLQTHVGFSCSTPLCLSNWCYYLLLYEEYIV